MLIAPTSVTRGGIQFAMDLPDQPGGIKVAADIIRKYGGRMVSILSTYDQVAEGWPHANQGRAGTPPPWGTALHSR